MAIREIITEGDPVLNKISRPVTKFDKKLHLLLDDMAQTLIDANGLGLAAVQIGILRRVVLVINGEDEMLELINPQIVEAYGQQEGLEGCLSVPGFYGDVVRPMHVKVRAQNRYGEVFEVEDEGLTARCFCHELEHLDGHLYRERATAMYRTEDLEQED